MKKSFCGAQGANNQCQYIFDWKRVKVAGIGLKLPSGRDRLIITWLIGVDYAMLSNSQEA